MQRPCTKRCRQIALECWARSEYRGFMVQLFSMSHLSCSRQQWHRSVLGGLVWRQSWRWDRRNASLLLCFDFHSYWEDGTQIIKTADKDHQQKHPNCVESTKISIESCSNLKRKKIPGKMHLERGNSNQVLEIQASVLMTEVLANLKDLGYEAHWKPPQFHHKQSHVTRCRQWHNVTPWRVRARPLVHQMGIMFRTEFVNCNWFANRRHSPNRVPSAKF